MNDRPAFRSTGLVVALAAEARVLTRRRTPPGQIVPLAGGAALELGGIGPAAAQRAAQALAEAGASALAAFGVAGALEAGLRNGDLLCPERVLDEQGRIYATDSAWRARLLQRLAESGLPPARTAPLLTLPTALATPAAKRAARDREGAVAVDMESAAVAAVAAARGLPFLALRAIVDELHDPLPSALQAGIDAFGRPQPLALIAVLGRDPALLAHLPRWYVRMRRATRALRAAVDAASPNLCH